MRPAKYLPPLPEPDLDTDELVRAQATDLLTTWAGWTGAGARGSVTVIGLGTVTVQLDKP